MKLALTIIWLILISLAICAQKSAPRKLDEYAERVSNAETVSAKTTTFLAKIKSYALDTRGAIIFYDRGLIEDAVTGGIVADKRVQNLVRKLVGTDGELDASRIIFINGGLSLHSKVEFWLVPPKAELPKATNLEPHFSCVCMELSVSGPIGVVDSAKRIRFLAWFGDGRGDARIKHNWTVSAGRIISGQGTDEIVVEIPTGAKEVRADLQISGTDPSCNCPVMASHTVRIITKKP